MLSRNQGARVPWILIKDCVELLNQMPDVSVGSEFYLDALDIFKKKSNREFFVSIPPEVRLSWLQRQI